MTHESTDTVTTELVIVAIRYFESQMEDFLSIIGVIYCEAKVL